MLDRIILLESNIKNLKNLKILFEKNPELLNEKIYEWSLRYGLLESIQIIIDIACSVTSKYNLGNPKSYSECIELLIEFNHLEKKLGKKVISMIGLRNLLAHEYLVVDVQKLFVFLDFISDFEEFIVKIREYA